MKLNDVRVREFIHPDSINVTVWEVEKVSLCTGKYAEKGDMYWKRITPTIEPFTDKKSAEDFMNKHT